MIPKVKGDANPISQTGEQWFTSQPEATQRAMMGPGKYEAWQGGQFDFAALTGQHDDAVFGTMKIEQTLKNLVGDE